MEFVQAVVFLDQAGGGSVQHIDVTVNIGRFIPGYLVFLLALVVDRLDAVLEVLQLLKQHTLLAVDDFLTHVVVKSCDLLQ